MLKNVLWTFTLYVHGHQCLLTSQMNLFLFVSSFTFYTVIMKTDFENIKKKSDHFQSKSSLLLYKMRILDTKWINSFVKSVKIDDGDARYV